MDQNESLKMMRQGIQAAMELSKCKKCGCMFESLESIKSELAKADKNKYTELMEEIDNSISKMEPIEYTCMGCKHCWSADITNAFDEAFAGGTIHSVANLTNCTAASELLPEIGEYHVLGIGREYPVAVSTLKNIDLADEIAKMNPQGLGIVGKTETENIGIEKIIKNVLALPSIKNLILCGEDSQGHYSGDAIISLIRNGVDDNMRVIGAKGKKPVLSNTTKKEVNDFRNQIEITDMINCEDLDEILRKIKELSQETTSICKGCSCADDYKPIASSIEEVEVGEKDPNKVILDKAGYFVIVPKASSHTILVEHYSNNNNLLRIIKGKDARNIYWSIIENGWITEMSHAAYLGKELSKAEMSMQLGFKYIQDKA